MIVGFFVYKDLKMRQPREGDGLNACVTLGMIALLLGGGTVLTRFLTREGVAQALAAGMLGIFHSKFMILISINLFLLLLGMFLDGIPILVLAVPPILPLARPAGHQPRPPRVHHDRQHRAGGHDSPLRHVDLRGFPTVRRVGRGNSIPP